MDQLVHEASTYFDHFVEAFATFEGANVARLFTFPYFSVDSNGSRRVFSGFEETAHYFQEHLNNYSSSGSKSCRYNSLEVIPIGEDGALATVTWSLMDAAGNAINVWRESYCVLRNKGKMLAYASIDHATPADQGMQRGIVLIHGQTMEDYLGRSVAQLREIIEEPNPLIANKVSDNIDNYAKKFIEQSPLLFIATASSNGRLDVSPKGDAPGFVKFIDSKTLIIPERPGNKLAYGFLNIIETGEVGLIFTVPGVKES
jgi:Pyridoxamine 5'-phosphate oxidase